jgi:lipopolysaccharide transport system permease protein
MPDRPVLLPDQTVEGAARIADVDPGKMSQDLLQSPIVAIPQVPCREQPVQPVENETVIAPSRGWIAVNWHELFRSRELLYFLVWRDVKVRYKQAVLGAAWVVLQPLFSMVLFTLLFGNVAGFRERMGPYWGPRYALFVFVAMLPWQLVFTGLNGGGLSLLNQTHLLTKIYFPRLYVPTSVVGGALFDFVISGLFVVALMVWYHVPLSPWIALLPLLLLLTIACSMGAAFLFSALTITYRDFRFLIPFFGQVWMWASFVAFPPSILGNRIGWKAALFLGLNPMYGIIAGWRKALLSGIPNELSGWNPWFFLTSIIVTAGLFVLGMFYFRRTERRFADIA